MNKDLFVSVVDSIRLQFYKDRDYSVRLKELFGVDVNPYDNSLLLDSLRSLVVFHFDKPGVLEEFDHYCYFQNFGRVENGEEVLIESSSALYDRLSSL